MTVKKWYTLAQAGELLGLSYMTMRRRVKDGSLRGVNIAPPASTRPNWRITEDELRRYQEFGPMQESA